MMEKDFQRRLEMIERGIHDLEAVEDPGVRAAVQQLVQAIIELHGGSLERLLEIVHAAGGSGPAIIDQLGRDPVVSPLLVLHSLHPLSLEARVLEALNTVRPLLRSKQVELTSISNGVVRVRLTGGPEDKGVLERALFDAAPDASAIDIEGGADGFVGFVPVESLRLSGSPRSVPHHLDDVPARQA
jgi:hypothetical protein